MKLLIINFINTIMRNVGFNYTIEKINVNDSHLFFIYYFNVLIIIKMNL